ncbi:MAG: sigma-54-dependent Fis family transcriptional regulator [Balneolaceae bacterium]|nr:MAG: sigma-54-dependent Fis family transcriptional regulator [Balneolaceae bacterium]
MARQYKLKILLTDDESSIRKALREILEYENYEVFEAGSGVECLELIGKENIDLMLLDIKMQGMDGMEVMEKLNEQGHDFPVIMLSGHGNIDAAVQATKLGAFDFLQKPPDLNRLLISVRNALEKQSLILENKKMRRRISRVNEIIGDSDPIKNIRNTIKKVAPTDARVLITGENGTGKELVARWLHEYSRRNNGPFVEVNCAAIPAELLESELFGHEKGAFTGAANRRIGKFEQADGGTLFLDEIGDMSPVSQAKVLRALQENVITRVGGSEAIKVDVRVLSATNKDLKEEIAEHRFREDLFHRLSVIPIHVPPLRERRNDIELLARFFLEELAGRDIIFAGKSFSDEAIVKLKELEWTGNIRELHNVVERLGILSPDNIIDANTIEMLAMSKLEPDQFDGMLGDYEDFQEFKEASENLFIKYHLDKNDWNISQTADKIGIQRSHLYNKIKKYQIER